MNEMLSALGLVLGLIVVLRWLLGFAARIPPRATGGLRVVESCALGPRQRLHVVEVGRERLLVSGTDAGVRLLRRLPPVSDANPGEDDEDVPARAARRAGPAVGRGALGRGAPERPRWGQLVARVRWPELIARMRGLGWTAGLALVVGLWPELASAAESAASPALSGALALLDPAAAARPDRLATTLEIVALMTLISVAPSILLMATCFTRIVIVLALLRQAIGINQLPPNQVMVGLALFLTFFVMAPVGEAIHEQALGPYLAQEIDAEVALPRAIAPAREFLLHHTRESDLALFLSLGKAEVASPEEVPLRVLLPSYMISELRTAFEFGFMVFLPFLIIDLVIASMLISMGMIVLPPIVISLPFKLMLFVLLDGWNLVVGSLITGLA